MTRRFFGQAVAAVFLLALVLGGCAGKDVKPSETSRQGGKAASQALSHNNRLVATAKIEWTTIQGRYPIRAALILQQPAFLRLEVLPVIGTPDFFLAAKPDGFCVYIPSSQEFYTGKPTAGNMARFFVGEMSIEDLVRILSGACPDLAGRHDVRVTPTGDGLLRVDMKSPVGPSQTIWMEKNDRMVKMVRQDSEGREIYSVYYDNYKPGNTLPEKITIQWADSVASLIIQYETWRIEQASDTESFELAVPAGAKIIYLD